MNQKIQIATGTIALFSLLAYTFAHTGELLSIYVRPLAIGYVAALGIELAVVSLSLRIGDLRRANQRVGFFLFVLVSVVGVSALANIASGFAVSEGARLTVQNVARLDVLQAIIGLSSTGLISLIVLALSEIIGTDVQAAVRRAERAGARLAIPEQSERTEPASVPTANALQTVNAERAASKQAALNALVSYLIEHPNASLSEAGTAIGKGKSTVSGYIDELTAAGRLNKNGHGYQVLRA